MPHIELNIPESADWDRETSERSEFRRVHGDDVRRRPAIGPALVSAMDRFDPNGQKLRALDKPKHE